MKLVDQTILITGGASGIGLGLANAFHALGNRVIVAGRSRRKLELAKNQGMETLEVDMTDGRAIAEFAGEAIRRFPSLNGVIHNAGIMLNEKLATGQRR